MIILTDPHGNFDTMMALLDIIPQEEKDKGIVICGDLIDRGPKSKEIIQYCIDNKIQVVRGNHEDMMVDEHLLVVGFMAKTGLLPRGNAGSLWTVNGGYETLQSYESYDEDVLDERGLPTRLFDLETLEEHVEWLKLLPYYWEFPDIKNDEGRFLVISHSNIGNVWDIRGTNDTKLKERFINTVAWGRPTKIDDVPEIYNVIGHTPQEHGPRIRKTYANIDTGCFWTRQGDGCGILTALQFPEMIAYEHENIDTKIYRDSDEPIKGKLTMEDIKERKKKHGMNYEL